MHPTNVIKAILLKIASAMIFAVMSGLVRYLGAAYPVGQVVFFRSAFAIVPVVVIYAWRREFEAAISFAAPLITVAMAALLLKEQVRIYRWSAVTIGFLGVLVMLVPHLDFGG